MITRLIWTTWTSLRAVRERQLNSITHSLKVKHVFSINPLASNDFKWIPDDQMKWLKWRPRSRELLRHLDCAWNASVQFLSWYQHESDVTSRHDVSNHRPLVCSISWSAKHQSKIKVLRYWPFERATYRSPMDSLNEGPIMRFQLMTSP